MSKHGGRNTLAQHALHRANQQEKQMDQPTKPADNGNGHGPEQPPSVMILTFAAPGSAELKLQTQNVSPAQILAASAWLEWYGRLQFDLQFQARMQAAEQNKIIVPNAVMPGDPIVKVK